MNISEEILLKLLKAALGNTKDIDFCYDKINWSQLYDIAEARCVEVIAYDGLNILYKEGIIPERLIPEKSIRVKFLQKTRAQEVAYLQYKHILLDLINFFKDNKLKVMLLKGIGLSLNYPRPNHRICGDIDVWMFGECAKAADLVESKLKIPVDKSHHHHTVYMYKGVMVEDHYDFVNRHAHKSSAEIEQILKQMALTEYKDISLDDVQFCIPTPTMNAMFLLRHSAQHFSSTGINLRQLLDWATFIEKSYSDINWDLVIRFAQRYNMNIFLDSLNCICVKYLGLSRDWVPEIDVNENLVDRIIKDIIHPEFDLTPPNNGILSLMVFKWKRWKSNIWKHKIVYNESMPLTLYTLIKSRFIIPKIS